MGKRILLVGLLTLALIWLASCGSKNLGTDPYPALSDGDRAGSGVTLGGFEVIRHNAAGNPDASLNGTLGLRLEDGALVISVDDSERTSAVTLDIKYDGTALNPERAEFSGLLGEPTQVLSLAVLDHAGRIGLGEAAIGSYVPGALHGDFATVYYTAGPARQASVMGSYAHSNPAGVAEVIREVPNLVAASDTGAGTASVSWTAGWHIADGDANSEVNSADIVPIAQKFGLNTAADWSSVQTDYDRNTETGAPDLQPIAVYYTNGTSEYLVQASDDTDGAARSDVVTLNFVTDQHAKNTPLAAGDLKTAYPWYEVVFDGTTAFTYAALTALDANANGMARIWITPRFPAGTTTDGVASSIDLAVAPPIPPKDNIFVNSYIVEVTGTDNGDGAALYGGNSETLGTVGANSAVTLQVDSIAGTFNGLAFDAIARPDDSGGEDPMTDDDYNTVFAAVQAAVQWTISHGGDAGFRRTGDWLQLATGSFPATGDPGDAVIFPDDDPESDAAGNKQEGLMTVTLPAPTSGYFLENSDIRVSINGSPSLAYSLKFDVLEDATAPLINVYGTTPSPVTELTYGENNALTMEIEWGTPGAPADLTQTSLELHLIDGNLSVDGGGAYPYVFAYSDIEPEVGEFTIRQTPEALMIICNIPGLYIQADSTYAFRVSNGTVWSSINKPAAVLTTAPPPPAQQALTIPAVGANNIDQIQIFYDDPLIRRNGNVTFDGGTGSVVPEDQAAYDDILKLNGNEFPVGITGTLPMIKWWPRVGLQELTAAEFDATQGDELESWYDAPTPDPDLIPGVDIVDRQKGRITLDVGVITPVVDPGAGTKYYIYKLFNSDGSTLVWGKFQVSPMPIGVTQPTPDNWAVDAWDRVEADYDASLFSDATKKALNGTTILTSTPDVLWFTWADGWYYDASQDPAGINPTGNNLRVRAKDTNSGVEMNMEMGLKIVGIGAVGTVIAVHTPTVHDFRNPSQAGWTGIFQPGRTYTLEVYDPNFPGVYTAYTDLLVVTGTNPNL